MSQSIVNKQGLPVHKFSYNSLHFIIVIVAFLNVGDSTPSNLTSARASLKKLDIPLVIGVAIGGLVLAGIIIALVCILWRMKRYVQQLNV